MERAKAYSFSTNPRKIFFLLLTNAPGKVDVENSQLLSNTPRLLRVILLLLKFVDEEIQKNIVWVTIIVKCQKVSNETFAIFSPSCFPEGRMPPPLLDSNY